MSDKAVYRSGHPDVIAVWDKAHKRAEEVGRARRALLDELGFEGRPALISDTAMLGVQHLPEHGPIPEGWRRDSSTYEAIVPDRRRKLGKEIGKRLNALSMPDLRKLLPGGMPSMAWDLENSKVHWAALKRFADAVFVVWGCDPEKAERGVKIDADLWHRIKLSEYYAIKEAAEEAGGDDV